ncbi:MAG TPA: sulfotransferase domain-containing protein [Amaricoccus sp.]|nr:sulfotransferase domain-containing protein [Amaricoccus sp.]
MGTMTRLLRPAMEGARRRLRQMQDRVLPDFVIIGAQKSGTSSLYRYLAQHPQVRESTVKEVHYFDGGIEEGTDTYALGERWYRGHFPLASEMAPGVQAYEASPLYLLHPLAAERMARLLPRVKLVAILRNPTDRALSHYFHNVRKNAVRRCKEELAPGAAMAAEADRLAPVLARGDYGDEAYRAYSYKARGRYLEQLERYWAHFPRESLLVLRAEDLFEDPAGLMGGLCDFLGLDRPAGGGDFRPANVGTNREAVDAGVRAELDAYFAPMNRALSAALGRDFGWEG